MGSGSTPNKLPMKNVLSLIFDAPDYARSWVLGTKEIEKEI